MRLTYYWLHVPSDKRGMRSGEFVSRPDLAIHLNFWNRMQPGIWVYWSSELGAPSYPCVEQKEEPVHGYLINPPDLPNVRG